MLYPEMYRSDRETASAIARFTEAGTRREKRCASRASAHWRRVQPPPSASR